MGLFRGLTVILIGFLAISLLKKRDNFKNVPVIGNLKPHGKYLMNDLHNIGGTPLLLKYLIEREYLDGDTLTVTLEGKKSSGAGASTHYLGGWSTSKELTIERY